MSVCPDIMHHDAGPSGYLQWHAWARRMARTHRQIKCTGCGLYVIWLPKRQSGEQ